jgi:hypothetical protein
MDGRNAGSAVIGFVNGMYILFNFILHISRPKEEKKPHRALSLSHTTQKEKKNIHKRHLKRKIGMTQTKRNT